MMMVVIYGGDDNDDVHMHVATACANDDDNLTGHSSRIHMFVYVDTLI